MATSRCSPLTPFLLLHPRPPPPRAPRLTPPSLARAAVALAALLVAGVSAKTYFSETFETTKAWTEGVMEGKEVRAGTCPRARRCRRRRR